MAGIDKILLIAVFKGAYDLCTLPVRQAQACNPARGTG